MSTLTTHPQASAARPQTTAMRRIINIAQLHLTDRFALLVMPLIILGFIFVVNYLIWLLVSNAVGPDDMDSFSKGVQFSGASSFIFVYMMVVAVQAMNFSFPFALGFGSTRRDFYLGSALTFVLLSVYYAAILTLLAWIEQVTGGWGLGGSMFNVVYLQVDNTPQRFLAFFLIFAFFFFLGAATGSIYVRWRAYGMYIFFGSLTLAIVGLVALATTQNAWPAVGAWFVENGTLGVSLWLLLPTAVMGAVGYLFMRWATPRS